MAGAHSGYFLIADITGYTMYLTQSELDHASEVLQTLLELLIDHTRPPLIIDRLAGDAVISYGLGDNFLSGQSFVELIEDTYVAFRKAIELMVLNNSCHCNACANISNLDLKFFVHAGSFTLQQLDGHNELLGPDVIVIHRLLKNHVTEKLDYRAYTLYTEAAIARLGLQEVSKSMAPHVEAYEHLGELQVWVQDMHPVWEVKKEQARITIAPDDVLTYEEAEFPIPQPVMWDIIGDPEYRSLLLHSIEQNILNLQGGRLAPGSVYQCFHGDNRVTMQTIIEWLPFEQMTTEDTLPIPDSTALINIKLTPSAGGTRVGFTCSKVHGPWLRRQVGNLFAGRAVRKQFAEGMKAFSERLERELAEGKFDLPQAAVIPAEEIEQAAAAGLQQR